MNVLFALCKNVLLAYKSLNSEDLYSKNENFKLIHSK